MDSGSFAHQPLADVTQDLSAFQGFIRELRRRRVLNVVFLYLVAAVPLLAFSADIVPILGIPGDPDTQVSIVVALTLASFPVILVLSWMFDITSEGIQRTESDASGAVRTQLSFLKGLGLILSFVLAGLIGWWRWP